MKYLKLFESRYSISDSEEHLKDYSIEKIDRNTYKHLLRKMVSMNKHEVSKLLKITPIYGSKLEYYSNSRGNGILVNDDYVTIERGEPMIINQVEDHYYLVMDKKTNRGDQFYYKCDDIGGVLKLLIIRHVFRLEEIKKVIDI